MPKKQTSSSLKYWEKRRELEDKARLKLEKKTLGELESVFERALVKIQRKLLSQADLHDITQSEMLEDFSKRDQEKYRKYIEKNYEKLMESDEAYKQFIDEYFPSYDYAKVNRLLQLRADIFSTLADEAIASDVNGKFNNDLENIIKRIYNSNSNALMQLLGGSAPGLTKNELENIMNYPWSGKTFSSRLWGNISTLEQRLSNSIINSLASGGGVVEALKTMKNDGVISGMFKLEQGKFNRSIENLVRTEYSHFAVEGIRESFRGANVKESESWSAEDERVCSICGGFHGQLIKNEHPPYHTLCRCTEIPRIPEISDDIDALYEEMFGNLLDEFASDQWGVKLTHPKISETKFDLKSVLDKTNMQAAVGAENYSNFLGNLNGVTDQRVLDLIRVLGHKLEFKDIKEVRAFAQGKSIQLSQKSLDGDRGVNPYQTVYHEIGHALDHLGLEALTGKNTMPTGKLIKRKLGRRTTFIEEHITHASSLSEYNIKEALERDFWKYVNGDLPSYSDLGNRPRNADKKKAYDDLRAEIYKTNTENLQKTRERLSKIVRENPNSVSAISDMIESIGSLGDYPLGFGHGKRYWQTTGSTETEFFAHMTEVVANDKSRELMKEIFPTAVSQWEKLVDDILKAVK
ncbi:structural protein [Enterococcus faecalis]|uniref:phage minor head protein n=1 Tax=Enterococcus faecalis TaxID=1351 RepID=UPI00032DD6DB|nr:phage minor head protein [Enterococcus faecalis]EHF1085602.1 head protein [Enterococcus faecalis]EOJ64645.1 phage minor head protein [Enterococcus faecalis EnGen0336]NBJ45443.1 head protein [Enterococcus faecalis]WOA45665.1 head protein [Enterococcus faecalis]HBK3296766.1 head protein [Enterococcus faecalis]